MRHSVGADQGRSQNFFFEGVMGYRKGGVLPKGTLSLAYALPGRNFGGGSNPQTPSLATSLALMSLDAWVLLMYEQAAPVEVSSRHFLADNGKLIS